jgi:hypothetical protein
MITAKLGKARSGRKLGRDWSERCLARDPSLVMDLPGKVLVKCLAPSLQEAALKIMPGHSRSASIPVFWWRRSADSVYYPSPSQSAISSGIDMSQAIPI